MFHFAVLHVRMLQVCNVIIDTAEIFFGSTRAQVVWSILRRVECFSIISISRMDLYIRFGWMILKRCALNITLLAVAVCSVLVCSMSTVSTILPMPRKRLSRTQSTCGTPWNKILSLLVHINWRLSTLSPFNRI